MSRVPIGIHGRDTHHLTLGSDPVPGGIFQTFSTPGALTVFNGNSRWYPALSGTLSTIYVAVGTAPTGASLIVRVNLNGGSLGTATIAISGFTSSFVPSTTTFTGPNTDYFTVDITQIGSTIAGSNLVVQFYGGYGL